MKYTLLILLAVFFANTASAQYALEDEYPNLQTFNVPTDLILYPDGSNRFLVLEQRGGLWIFNPQNPTKSRLFWDGTKIVSPNGCEDGLLGCAFHPDFANNHYIYLSYTTGSDPQWTSHIVRYECATSKPDTIIPSTALDILTIVQPTGFCNHKGGCLQFGPDGFLYASFGDGGSGGDPYGNGQNKSVLLGKILRLDVDHQADGNNYAIPADNPFATNTQGFKKEIYAYGLRNTWKFSFDKVTGKLWASDVGQNTYEEIDTIVNGGNYGWKKMEGFHCYHNGNDDDFNCDSTGLIIPLWEYIHPGGAGGSASITGGYIYHGSAIPSLQGKYIYGDEVSGKVWALTTDNGPVTNQLLVDKQSPSISITSFAEDQNKEIYATSYAGKIYKLVTRAAVGDEIRTSDYSLNIGRTLLDATNSSTTIYFKLSQQEQAIVSIVDAAGREVRKELDLKMETGEHSLQINASSIANGMYLIRLSTNEGTLTQKIIVAH